MIEFVLELILFLSLGTVIYTLTRAVPRLEDGATSPKLVRNWLQSMPVHKLDAALSAFLEKNLRRVRVLVLRVDNGLTSFANRIKAKGANADPTQGGLFAEKTEGAVTSEAVAE